MPITPEPCLSCAGFCFSGSNRRSERVLRRREQTLVKTKTGYFACCRLCEGRNPGPGISKIFQGGCNFTFQDSRPHGNDGFGISPFRT
ncbi:hypothetical protein NEIMUCOT_05068 [Neisseria mucosa ATCC 25996]|uniref:Uncharacterized protein n=1 Tax=Neisseria mucosa (strain ATCC 25996 / DSM 4631 / NCTC 10774 / M26) TaxID=546266 RepID=D2ZWS0_NEIM2|nr:hypothetical protein NEIMUCOT_05068 [Neisseria mucosa ATCC 25996]